MTEVRKRIAITLALKCKPRLRRRHIRLPSVPARIEQRAMRAVYVAGGQTLATAERIVNA